MASNAVLAGESKVVAIKPPSKQYVLKTGNRITLQMDTIRDPDGSSSKLEITDQNNVRADF